MTNKTRCLSAAILALLVPVVPVSGADRTLPSFDRDIRPLLADRCFACHGPDAGQRQAGLRLDEARAASAPLESGRRAIVAGDVEQGELLRRIDSDDPDSVMPPADSGKSLSDAERQLLRAWIENGAKYDKHWSFDRLAPTSPPRVGNAEWSKSPIDRFVLAKLEENEMEPSEQTDRVTLIRRLSLDLRGLPPSIEEVDAFVADDSPRAYEKLVDRLLDSVHYGEKMTQDWLDLARYGDTNGYHADSDRDMWLYRDYVIAAFNNNKPFDQFILENMAGDLLPNPTDETRIASGFNRNNTFNEEGGADPDEFYVAYAVDRANTTGRVFLGLTFECAQCHDHKYDPLTQKEYYQFYAFFNSVDGEVGAGGPSGYHSKPLPPLLSVKTADYNRQLKQLDEHIASAAKSLEDQRAKYQRPSPQFDEALTEWAAELSSDGGAKQTVTEGLTLWLSADDINGNGVADSDEEFASSETVAEWKDRSANKLVASATGSIEYVADAIGGKPAVALDGSQDFFRTDKGGEQLKGDFTMIAVLQHKHLDNHQMMLMWGEEAVGKRRAMWKFASKQTLSFNGYARDVVGTLQLTTERAQIAVITKQGDANKIQFFLDGKAGGEGTAQLESYESTAITIGANNAGNEKTAADYAEVLVFNRALSEPEHRQIGSYLASKYSIASDYTAAPEAILAIAKTESEKRTKEQSTELRQYFARHVYAESRDQLAKLETAVADLKQRRTDAAKKVPTTMVMVEKAERNPAYVLMRGDFQNPGDRVQPDVPSIFPRMPEGQPRNRLGLAHWLIDSEHPLTARVTVNRLWKQLFGTGLVKTMGDFGTQGERPSHPELLDWLAIRFVQSGWNVKALQKQILMSATYRQSSVNRHRYDELDPYNRLYARAPRFRLSAEEIRDNSLAISGLLTRRVGGPSVKPYQPAGYYADKIGRGWDQSKGEDLYRRGIYTYWRRTTLYPTFQIFDAPSREVCTANRPRTNTPLQALVLLNDPTYVEASRVFGQRVLAIEDMDDAARLEHAFRLAVARRPTEEEFAVLQDILDRQRSVYEADIEAAKKIVGVGEAPTVVVDSAELASWMMLCSALLNLDETITRE